MSLTEYKSYGLEKRSGSPTAGVVAGVVALPVVWVLLHILFAISFLLYPVAFVGAGVWAYRKFK